MDAARTPPVEGREADKSSLHTAVDINGSQHYAPKPGQPLIIQKEEYVQSRGVTRMENVAYFAKHGGKVGRNTYYLIGVSVLVCMFVSSMEGSTVSNYQQFATSTFNKHSEGLAALSIATGIISAVSKPFIAKLGDITSRPTMFSVILTIWTLGFIIAASSSTLSAYIVGSVFIAIGSSGIDLISDIICGDLVPLQWRGFCSSLLAFPYFITTWFTGLIVDALAVDEKWRWGYGMWAIIFPVALTPAIIMLFFLERKAQQSGVVNIASSKQARRAAEQLAEDKGEEYERGRGVNDAAERRAIWPQMKAAWSEIDAFGLILMGFGWSLLLLPFSLKSGADNGWKNPSLIAMMVIGGVLLIVHIFYERYYAKYPTMPKRILQNKTFLMAVLIDFVYMLAGSMRSLYFGSYVWIVTDLVTRDWSYLINSLTLALCFFGLMAGLIQRWTHRYKLLQIIGLGIKIIGMGLLVSGGKGTTNIVNFVFIQLLIGAGGAFSVVGSRVASQASVPHQDLGLVISLLSLWSKIGSSIGSAVAGAVWGEYMPTYLRQDLPASVTDAQVAKYFGNIKTIRAVGWGNPIRDGAISAYQRTVWKLWMPALILSFIPFIAAFFQTNYFLGNQQNAVTNTDIAGQPIESEQGEKEAASGSGTEGFKGKLIKFWAGRP